MSDFETDFERLFSQKIKNDEDFCKDIYSALTNLEWVHKDGAVFGCTFRSAGGWIADIREEGGYMDWYCCQAEGVATDEIQKSLGSLGWTCREYEF